MNNKKFGTWHKRKTEVKLPLFFLSRKLLKIKLPGIALTLIIQVIIFGSFTHTL